MHKRVYVYVLPSNLSCCWKNGRVGLYATMVLVGKAARNYSNEARCIRQLTDDETFHSDYDGLKIVKVIQR